MNDVDGATSGPKNSSPPVGSPHPTGVPMVVVSMLAMSVCRDRNRSYRVPPVAPVFVKVNWYTDSPPFGVTVYVSRSAFSGPIEQMAAAKINIDLRMMSSSSDH